MATIKYHVPATPATVASDYGILLPPKHIRGLLGTYCPSCSARLLGLYREPLQNRYRFQWDFSDAFPILQEPLDHILPLETDRLAHVCRAIALRWPLRKARSWEQTFAPLIGAVCELHFEPKPGVIPLLRVTRIERVLP